MMRALRQQWRSELRLFVRNRQQVAFGLLFPLAFLLLFGAIFGQREFRRRPMIDFMLPGYLVMSMLSIAFMSVSISLALERQRGVLRRLGSLPRGRPVLMAAKVLSGFVFGAVGMALLTLLAVAAFGARPGGDALSLLVVLVLGMLAFGAMGIAMGGLVKGEAAPAAGNLIYLPMLFLGGTFFPTDTFPQWLLGISRTLPSYHATNALYGVMVEGKTLASLGTDVLVIAAWGLAALVLALRTFQWE